MELEGDFDPFGDELVDEAALLAIGQLADLLLEAKKTDFEGCDEEALRDGVFNSCMLGYNLARMALGSGKRALRYTTDILEAGEAASNLVSASLEFNYEDLVSANAGVEACVLAIYIEDEDGRTVGETESDLRFFARQRGFCLGVAEEDIYGSPNSAHTHLTVNTAVMAAAVLQAIAAMVERLDELSEVGSRARTPGELRSVARSKLEVLDGFRSLLPFPDGEANAHLTAAIESLSRAEQLARDSRPTLFGRARMSDARAAESSLKVGFGELELATKRLVSLVES
jgi:hypothetical protein